MTHRSSLTFEAKLSEETNLTKRTSKRFALAKLAIQVTLRQAYFYAGS